MTRRPQQSGQTLAFVLLAMVALALVAAVGTRLIAAQQADRADRAARARLASAFGNRLREAAQATSGTPACTPVRRLAGDSSTTVVDLNGDALEVARGLHLLVRDLGLGADGIGFEAAGAPPTTAEDSSFDAGWVLAHRRSLAGDRFTSPADLARVARDTGLIWGDAAGARELAGLLPFLEAAPVARAAIAPVGALVDLNGDALELARLLHHLLETATGPDGLPLGRNGLGIELAADPPTSADLAPATDGKLADVVAIVRARLDRSDGQFADPSELYGVPQLVRESGAIRSGAPIWGPTERWELERLERALVARDEPQGPRQIDVGKAARAVLVAAFAVHLSDLLAAGSPTAAELADDWIDRRRTLPAPTELADLDAFLVAHGITTTSAHLTRFAIGPGTRHVARFGMVALSAETSSGPYYREGAGTGWIPLAQSPVRAFTGRLDPRRLATAPLAAVPPELDAGDPFALDLRGGRPLASTSDRLDAGAPATTATVALPAGTRAFAWRVWLSGTGGDADIQALAVHDSTPWRARAVGGIERRLDLGGALGVTWVPMVAGLDPDEPVIALAAVTDSGLYALTAAGDLRAWDSVLERWSAVATPPLDAEDRTSAVCCARVGLADRLYIGTREGRVFHATAGGAWTELVTVEPTDPARILALTAIDPATNVLAAGVLDRGIWELAAAAPAWVRVDTAGVVSAGTFTALASGELVTGTSAGIWTRSIAGTWSADPGLTSAVATVCTDGVTPYAGTIGAGIYARGVAGWSEVGGAPSAGQNIRAMAVDGTGALVWGAAADGGIAIEAAFSAGGVEVGAIPPARIPLAGGGPRRLAKTATLTMAADTVALRAVRYRRTGSPASSIPVLLELSLEDGGALAVGPIRPTAGSTALDPPPIERSMRQER